MIRIIGTEVASHPSLQPPVNGNKIVLYYTLEGVVPARKRFVRVTVDITKKYFSRALRVGSNSGQSQYGSTQAHDANTRPLSRYRANWLQGTLFARQAKIRWASDVLPLNLAIAIASTAAVQLYVCGAIGMWYCGEDWMLDTG